MNALKSIAVFCGSSVGNDAKIIAQSKALGTLLAQEKIAVVYGGAKIGIMGNVADAALAHKGKVIGVIPEFLKLKEVVHLGLQELITTDTMHQRKMKLQELSDGFITLPGGFGTFEELFEVITWAQLGLHQKPVGVLNSNGFYDDLIAMLKTMVTKGLLKKDNLEMLIIDTQVESLLEKMRNFTPKALPKWCKV
ncbi:MAG: TIGR00730 family Rossman fold protein [Flavobacteriaceae bacterium]|nr:TIGR00730 family Rossman fold protein [Flavobacteriaceae bacterium]